MIHTLTVRANKPIGLGFNIGWIACDDVEGIFCAVLFYFILLNSEDIITAHLYPFAL